MNEWACCRDEAADHQLLRLWLFLSYYISQPMENIEVLPLINCLAWKGMLLMDNTFPMKKTQLRWT